MKVYWIRDRVGNILPISEELYEDYNWDNITPEERYGDAIVRVEEV